MKQLLNTYGLNSTIEYFYMINDSYINGQFLQAHNQIKQLPKKNKKELLLNVTIGYIDIPKEVKEWIIKHALEVI
jgi:hypothetical protein